MKVNNGLKIVAVTAFLYVEAVAGYTNESCASPVSPEIQYVNVDSDGRSATIHFKTNSRSTSYYRAQVGGLTYIIPEVHFSSEGDRTYTMYGLSPNTNYNIQIKGYRGFSWSTIPESKRHFTCTNDNSLNNDGTRNNYKKGYSDIVNIGFNTYVDDIPEYCYDDPYSEGCYDYW